MLAAPTLRAAATIGRSRDDSVWPYDDAKQFRRARASATDDA